MLMPGHDGEREGRNEDQNNILMSSPWNVRYNPSNKKESQ